LNLARRKTHVGWLNEEFVMLILFWNEREVTAFIPPSRKVSTALQEF
jgi:hypothetical protein